MDKLYRVTMHFLFVTEVEAESERFAISIARDKLHAGGRPDETNNEVEEITDEQ